ncbi:hypothetical protein LCGC14_2212290 [marine sediment metagenome]|uniref:Uncharacterized protein n=1 Tax=marine sediment metagenome TaxID=412755 RepID=A0A0F9G923_9ZZZZ
MADNGFNGSVFTFPTTGTKLNPLRSVNHAIVAAKVDVSGSTSATKLYRTGLPDPTMSITIVGTNASAIGTTGEAKVVWQDATNDTVDPAVLVSNSAAGSQDGEILSTLEFAPLG